MSKYFQGPQKHNSNQRLHDPITLCRAESELHSD